MQGLMVVGFIVDEILKGLASKMTKSLEHEI